MSAEIKICFTEEELLFMTRVLGRAYKLVEMGIAHPEKNHPLRDVDKVSNLLDKFEAALNDFCTDHT